MCGHSASSISSVRRFVFGPLFVAAVLLCARASGQDYDSVLGESSPVWQEYDSPASVEYPQEKGLSKLLRYGYGDPDYPNRHVGKGQPLIGRSWLNRHLYVGAFGGGLFGDEIIRGRVDQKNGTFGGVRIGWDTDHYWAWETRAAVSQLGLIGAAGQSDVRMWDVSLVHHPWGDAKWRPFLSVGAGLASFDFADDRGRRLDELLLQVPAGVGIKHYVRNWLTLRLDAYDNIAFGDAGLRTMHNFSFTGVVELRFGGPRTIYYPYDPGPRLW